MTEKIRLSHKVIKFTDLDKKWDEVKAVLDYDFAQKGKKSPKINKTIFAYDSETTNYTKDGKKLPYAFSEMLTILNMKTNKNVNILCRDIKDYLVLEKRLAKELGCSVVCKKRYDKMGKPVTDPATGEVALDESENKYMNIYVHNLAFDSSFLLPIQNVYKMFASDMHKPYYYITENGGRYVDTVVLTQKRLEELGKELTLYDDRKHVGDFDYDKIRTPKTAFTIPEYGYVTSDTTVLAAYMSETIHKRYGDDISKVDLTMTGIVRSFVQSVFKTDSKVLKELDEEGVLNKKLSDYVQGKYKPKSKNDYKKLYYNTLGKSGFYYKLSYKQYVMARLAYTGGFTHANANLVGKILKNLISVDFTSSYPTRILSEAFAIGSGREITREALKKDADKEKLTVDDYFLKVLDECNVFKKQRDYVKKIMNRKKQKHDYNYMLKYLTDIATGKEDEIKNNFTLKRLFMFKVSFKSIVSKIDFEHYLSVSKLVDYDKDSLLEDNGRVVCVNEGSTYMTNIDFDTFSRCYDIEGIRFDDIYCWNQRYLPKAILYSTLNFYLKKTKLKGIPERKEDYMRGKMMLNSVYGMCVQDPLKDPIVYENGKWAKVKIEKLPTETKNSLISQYNENRSRYLYYIWGVEISAYSRHELWEGILAMGDDYVYADTDSLKILNSEKHLPWINAYNDYIVEKIELCLEKNEINPELASPKDIKGKKHPLGVWDPDDGNYSYFKTLGAKRYIDISRGSDIFEITIAGLSKKAGAEYMLDKAKACYTEVKKDGVHIGWKLELFDEKTVKKLFDIFSDQMFVPAEKTGKLAHFYARYDKPFYVTDYQGKTAKIPAGGGCLLKPVDFTMSLADRYLQYLDMLADGYILDPDSIIKQPLR